MNTKVKKKSSKFRWGVGGGWETCFRHTCRITLRFLHDVVSSVISTAHHLIPRKASDSCAICCIVTLPRTAASYRKIRLRKKAGNCGTFMTCPRTPVIFHAHCLVLKKKQFQVLRQATWRLWPLFILRMIIRAHFFLDMLTYTVVHKYRREKNASSNFWVE